MRSTLRLSIALNAILVLVPIFLLCTNVGTEVGIDTSAWRAAASQRFRPRHPDEHAALWSEMDEEDIDLPEHRRPKAVQPVQVPLEAKQATPPAPIVIEPCTICTAGDVGRRLCDTWGEDAMTRLVAYSGTNHRLRRVLAKMRAGKPFTVAAVGGSVTIGHGLDWEYEDSMYKETNMHRVLFDHLDKKFPSVKPAVLRRSGKGVANAFINAGQAARGSDYFSMCSQLHVPKDVDLVIVELAINDPLEPHSVKTYERLLRALLEYDNKPAVLAFNTFALEFDEIAMGGDINHGTSQFYDVPTLSSRNALLPILFQNETKAAEWFSPNQPEVNPETLYGVDLRHISPVMHGISGDLMSAYIDLQLCEMDRIEAKFKGIVDVDKLYPLDPVPSHLLTQKWRKGHVAPKLQPRCETTDSEEYPLIPKKNVGWRRWAWKQKKYLIADKPGSVITFELDLAEGHITLYYLRSSVFGLGSILCDVVGVEGTDKVIDGYWDQEYNIGQTTEWDGLPVGKTTLRCELLKDTADPGGGTEFRLMSLMSI